MCSSAPDMTAMNTIAATQAKLSQEQLDWAKSIYADTAPDRAAATARANTVSDAQLAALNKQTALTDDYAAYNKGTFRPLEQSIVADANNFNTPERIDAAVGKATADVNSGFSNVQGQQQRSLARMGVNPNSGKALALGNQTAIAQAAALAGASNKARTDTETLGRAMKMDAASLGRNLPANQATSAGLAVNQGNAAVASGMQSGNINAQGANIMQTGFNGASNTMGNAGSLYGSIANIQNTANAQSSPWGAIGQVAGQFAGSTAGSTMLASLSDKKAKKNIKKVSGKSSLAAFRKMPVSNWDYKTGKGDGGNHTGPMAQDVQKGLGNSVAPGGKMIDMISMAGHQINAIKELDKRLAKVENRA